MTMFSDLLQHNPSLGVAGYDEPRPEEARAGRRQRFTPFLPPTRGVVRPVAGPASDPAVARALAQSGGGWVAKDGRVLTRGSCPKDDALQTLPETAAVVADFEQAQADLRARFRAARDESMARYGDFSVGSFNVSNPEPDFQEFLDRAGWLKIELCRDHGVPVMGALSELVEVDDYREPLVTLSETLGCLAFDGSVRYRARLLYDPSDPEGLGNGVRSEDGCEDEGNRFKAKWLSSDEIGHDEEGGYYYVLDEKRRVSKVNAMDLAEDEAGSPAP